MPLKLQERALLCRSLRLDLLTRGGPHAPKALGFPTSVPSSSEIKDNLAKFRAWSSSFKGELGDKDDPAHMQQHQTTWPFWMLDVLSPTVQLLKNPSLSPNQKQAEALLPLPLTLTDVDDPSSIVKGSSEGAINAAFLLYAECDRRNGSNAEAEATVRRLLSQLPDLAEGIASQKCGSAIVNCEDGVCGENRVCYSGATNWNYHTHYLGLESTRLVILSRQFHSGKGAEASESYRWFAYSLCVETLLSQFSDPLVDCLHCLPTVQHDVAHNAQNIFVPLQALNAESSSHGTRSSEPAINAAARWGKTGACLALKELAGCNVVPASFSDGPGSAASQCGFVDTARVVVEKLGGELFKTLETAVEMRQVELCKSLLALAAQRHAEADDKHWSDYKPEEGARIVVDGVCKR